MDQINKQKEEELKNGTWSAEKETQYTKNIEESKVAWGKYQNDTQKYQFLQERIKELADADETSRTALGLAKSDILSGQRPVKLTLGTNLVDDVGSPVNAYTIPQIRYARMPEELGGRTLGYGSIVGFTVAFDYDRIISDKTNSAAAVSYQLELQKSYSTTKVESTATSTFVHELGHIRYTLRYFGGLTSKSAVINTYSQNEKFASDFEKYYLKQIYPR